MFRRHKDKEIFDNFLIQGNDEFKKNRKHVKNALDKYLLKNDIIEGSSSPPKYAFTNNFEKRNMA